MYFTYKMFIQILEEFGFICFTLNNVCTLHTIGFATQHLLQSVTRTNPTYSNTVRSLSHTCTHTRAHTRTQHINTSTPTEASNHKQYTQARTRGNVLGRYRTLLRQVPDFYIYIYVFFCAENEITQLLDRRIFLNNSCCYKVHFTLQWMDIII